MKISELLVELEKLMWQEGDQDVYVRDGCGCCEWPVAPAPHMDCEYKGECEGLYLN